MSSFSANKICNRIKTTLEAYDAGGGVKPFENKCHNHFGEEIGDLRLKLQQSTHIYIFFAGEDYEVEANETMSGILFIEMWIVDQIIGVDPTKSDFQADNMRAYLTSESWKDLGIPTDYPDMDFEPFFLDSVRPAILTDDKGNPTGNMVSVFRGHLNFANKDLT